MAEVTPQKRVLPARDRRDPASKRRASSPAQLAAPASASTPAVRKQTSAVSSEPRHKRPYKKRASLVRVQTPISVSRSPPSISVGEDVLPTRIVANQPLPTIKEKQPSNLSVREYQSIAESAVIAASLHRSRMQWLYHGIFEKYWVKPVKRKGVIEAPPNNPDAKSMQRLGAATMTIEPHTFDIVFYTVRDQTGPPPFQRHPNQHALKHMAAPPPPPHSPYTSFPPPGPYHHAKPLHPPPSASPSPSTSALPRAPNPPAPVRDTPPSAVPSPSPIGPPPNQIKQEKDSRPCAASFPPNPPPAQSPREQPQTPRPESRPNPPPGGRGSTTDPVIQMLAARAASDPQLKELMKIVATSRASPEQLKEFQAHIDEFNEVIRRQEVERLPKGDSRPPSQQPPSTTPTVPEASKQSAIESNPTAPSSLPPGPSSNPSPTMVPGRSSTYNPSQPPPRQHPDTATPAPPPPASAGPPLGPGVLPGVMHTFPHVPPPTGRGGPMGSYIGYHPQPPQPPPPPPARPEPFIKHIVMEITSVPSGNQAACPDRWLFPEYAVLEIRPGGLEMICSFLVERKGSQMTAGGEPAEEKGEKEGKWQAEQEYYQPVTMSIKALNHRTIETIAKAAKILPVVQEHMKEVMSKKQRAPVEYLVHQLPRERSHVGADGTETGFVDSGVDLGSDSASEDDELKDVYGI
ncbi:uncharacterized protein PV07_09614 [Cladophialophora immunda]|uniref:SWR1-complex protein 3 domain-containing protein n=1 Tax=Cladophialophora immunda TaxID=569365 RepID=A0A0D2AN78_9EURO|nr:uncharacterized protein PV07_09614 [Cladophialophora immunda]KIW26527.1 hypothetical protein PV07_09614 [Cladophialophora immunda]OQV02377.1 hypothetical protein CLAIMM_07582 [Cladophialophora immunda]